MKHRVRLFLFLRANFLSLLGTWAFPHGSDGKESAYNAEDLGLIPGLERSPGEGNGYPLQYSCLRIPWTEEPGGIQSMELERIGHD